MSDSPVTKHGANSGEAPAEASPQEQKQMEQAYAQMKRKMSMAEIGKKIKHKVMVLSGKGGVGKSTVSTGLALALAQQGLKVGILDIDITGPNVPKMMGLDGRRLHVESGRIHPAQGHLGVKVISIAFLLDNEDTPVVWRGPIKLGAIQQFIGDVEWGNLDYLIIDFPPGTSDEPLTVAQSLPNIDGMVIVTTPQDVALLDARKAINMFERMNVPILGMIENMSSYHCPKCGHEEHIFGHGGAKDDATKAGLAFLGEVPLQLDIRLAGDGGTPIAATDSPHGAAYTTIAQQLIDGGAV